MAIRMPMALKHPIIFVTRMDSSSKRHFCIGIITWAVVLLSFTALAHAAETNSTKGVSGTWEGTRRPTGLTGTTPYKVQSVKFDLVQSGEAITGSFRCYAGSEANMGCPNPRGKITSGTMSSGTIKLTVQTLPNGIICRYVGKTTALEIEGTYRCYAGGSLSTIGVWKVKR